MYGAGCGAGASNGVVSNVTQMPWMSGWPSGVTFSGFAPGWLASPPPHPVSSTKEIAAVATDLKPNAGENVIDAKGCYVTAGWIDLHVHFREPGFEYKETIDLEWDYPDAHLNLGLTLAEKGMFPEALKEYLRRLNPEDLGRFNP